jgi:hypothetical protein
VLDWIFQIARKPWCTSEDIHYLLDAFDALLRPQAHLCAMGIDHEFNASRFLREQVQKGIVRARKAETHAEKTDDDHRAPSGRDA